jgi:hypothetical protein
VSNPLQRCWWFETRAEDEQWKRTIEVEMDKGAFVSRAEAESAVVKVCCPHSRQPSEANGGLSGANRLIF